MYIRHLSRVRTRARIRRFWTFVFTSSPLPFKTLCVNGLRVKVSLPFFLHPRLHRRFWRFMYYAYFMHYEVINGHSAGRGRGRGGKIRKAENKRTKCEGKGGVKPSPLTHYKSDSWERTKKNKVFTRNSLCINRLQRKGEEVKVVFRKQLMRTRARKDGRKVGKARRFSRIGHGFVLSTSKCNKSGSSDIWSDAGLKGEKR